MIRIMKMLGSLSLLLFTALAFADQPRLKWHSVDADMGAEEYRQVYRENQDQLRNFVEDYSEASLVSLGVPKRGVNLIGAVAGAAVTQEATFYLNDGKSWAIDIRDAAEDDRAVYFGLKLDW